MNAYSVGLKILTTGAWQVEWPILSGRHLLSVTLIGSQFTCTLDWIWFANKHTWL